MDTDLGSTGPSFSQEAAHEHTPKLIKISLRLMQLYPNTLRAKMYFLMALKAGKSNIKALVNLLLIGYYLCLQDGALNLCSPERRNLTLCPRMV